MDFNFHNDIGSNSEFNYPNNTNKKDQKRLDFKEI